MNPINTFLGTGSGSPLTPATPTQGTQTYDPNHPIGSILVHPLDSIGAAASGAATTAVSSAFNSTLFSSRVVAIILGLIAIAGAILLYLGEDISGAIGVAKKGLE